MKICLVADNINPRAGLGRMVQSIADGLVEKGHSIGFVVSKGESVHPVLRVGFRFSIKNIFGTVRDLFAMRSFFSKYDVIVCLDVQPAGILAKISTIWRKDVVVVHSLGTYSLFTQTKKIKNKLIDYVYNQADRVWIINDFVQRKISESCTVFSFADNIGRIPVGVDTSLFSILENPSYTYAQHYIISVGAIKPRKGQLDSVMAFNTIKNTYPELKYILVGAITDSDVYYQAIVSYIEEHKLEERVIFIQNVTDTELIDLYSGAQFFVLTPTSSPDAIEGFGMVYIEAALCGITAIGTVDTGAEAAILADKTGILATQGDVQSIAKAMKTLMEDSDQRVIMATHARERALTYDWQHVVDLYEQELSKLITWI